MKKITKETILRYSNRYRSLGADVKTLGWGSLEQQRYRFEQTLRGNVDFTDRVVVDVGCGFGDYGLYLLEKGIAFRKYIGLDLNQELLRAARRRHRHNKSKNVSFRRHNLLNDQPGKPVADIAVMLGLLNFNQQGIVDNYEYSSRCIRNAWSLTREVLIVDFLSSQLFHNYPKEDFVFYHDPVHVLDLAFKLCPNVALKHDYAPIPQKEFMLFLFKKEPA